MRYLFSLIKCRESHSEKMNNCPDRKKELGTKFITFIAVFYISLRESQLRPQVYLIYALFFVLILNFENLNLNLTLDSLSFSCSSNIFLPPLKEFSSTMLRETKS
jgi:hypothetical protein